MMRDIMRRSGVLLPVTSIPSKYGIGAFSKEAYEFVDFLVRAGQSLWQILPLGPTGYGDSPYQSFSTYAGNPYFIDLEKLIEAGWITKEDCREGALSKEDGGGEKESPENYLEQRYVDYGKIYETRFDILRKAYRNSHIESDEAYAAFCEKNAFGGKSFSL